MTVAFAFANMARPSLDLTERFPQLSRFAVRCETLFAVRCETLPAFLNTPVPAGSELESFLSQTFVS
jgi:hypothetical protein